MIKNKNIIFIGEFLGSCFLVMIIVGSGIMAENLTDDNAVRLLANTIATGAGLFVLIISFADISGAHFNPFVTLAMFFNKKIKSNVLITYISAQIIGCMVGVMIANIFFEHEPVCPFELTHGAVDVYKWYLMCSPVGGDPKANR